MNQSFSTGWAVAFGVIALALEAARHISDSQSLLSFGVLVAGCGIGLGGGAFLAFAAPSTPLRARLAVAALWTAIGAVAAAVNLYLWVHQPSSTYDSYSRVGSVSGLGMREHRVSRSRVLVNARYTIALVGLLGGLATSLMCRFDVAPRRVAMYRLGWTIVWTVAFAVGGTIGYYAWYLLRAAFTDMAEEFGLIPAMGKYAGSVAGGVVAGYVASVIAKRAPGLLRVASIRLG
jgi:hypothetical protein